MPPDVAIHGNGHWSIGTGAAAIIFKLASDRLGHGPLGIARSLGRLGVPVYLATRDAHSPTARSRYVRGSIVFGRGSDRDEIVLGALHALADRTGGRPVLIATDDLAALFVDRNRATLEVRFALPAQPDGVPLALSNKQRLHELCLEHGIPTPEARMPRSSAELRSAAAELGFPLVVKTADPRAIDGTAGRASVAIVRDYLELERLFSRSTLPGEGQEVMLQEFIPGGSLSIWMFNGYFDREGMCRMGVVAQKVRQAPPRTGATTLGVVMANAEVRELAITFLRAVGYRGIVDLGFRFDARDGRYKLLDVNPRVGSTFRLFAEPAGMDVVRALYLDMTGQPIPESDVRPGRRWLVEDLDAATAMKLMRTRELGLRQYLGSLRGVDETAWLARDDLAPAAAAARASFARLLGASSALLARPTAWAAPASRARNGRT